MNHGNHEKARNKDKEMIQNLFVSLVYFVVKLNTLSGDIK